MHVNTAELKAEALARQDDLIELRRAFHRHPELSGREEKTAARVAETLRALELPVTTGVAGHGVVALLEGGLPGPTALVRADLDALPVTEATGVPWASESPGVMHACGHDCHVAIALGVASLLCARRASLPGRIKFVFQPSEEVPPGGAEPMIRAGVLDAPKVDAAFALHVYPGLPAGAIALREGALFAQADDFDLEVRGRGGHGAPPHQGADALAAACAIVDALHAVRTRRIDPVQAAVISVGRIEGGSQRNVLCDRVRIEGTARAVDPAVAAQFPQLIADAATGVAQRFGVEAKLEYLPGYPPLVNDARLTAHVRAVAETLWGVARVIGIPAPVLAGEDFAHFARAVPGVMFLLGVGDPQAESAAPLHHPAFCPDERALAAGVATLAAAVASWCAGAS